MVEEIKNLKDTTYDDLGNTIEGECEQYLYTIDEKFNVIVGQKISGSEIKGDAKVVDSENYLEKVEIQVVATLSGGTITSIESLSDGVVEKSNISSSEKRYYVTDNGTYIFRITGNNGRRIKVSCTVTNAIPIKKDLLTAVADIKTSGISKCKVIGKTRETATNEEKIYSLDTIVHKGDLILDGASAVEDILPKAGKIYEFGYERDISDGTNYAKYTVVLKVEGNLTIQSGVTLTSVKGGFGGPKGMIVYCTGTLENNGDISMSNRGAYAEGENVYIYQNNDSTYEFIPAEGGSGGSRTCKLLGIK